MHYNQIQYFLAIARTKSFSEAAYELSLSQSSISKQIKALEDELGISLFNRSSHQRELTAAGKVFFRFAQTACEQQREMLEELAALKKNISTTLRLGNLPVSPMYLNFNIGSDWALFQNNWQKSELNFDIFEGTQGDILKELYNHNADFGLLRLEKIPNPEDFDYILLSHDTLVAVVNKDHPLARRKKVSLATITEHPLFLLSKETELRAPVISAFASQGLMINIHGESPRPKIIQGMLTQSMDVGLLPKNVVDLNTFKELRIVPLEEKITSKLVVVRLREAKHSELAKAFWEFACELHTVADFQGKE